MSALVEAVGSVAGLTTTLSWLPQAVKTIRTRETHAISLWMQVLFNCGIALWLAYGVLIGSWPLILANGVTQLLAGTILVLKLRYG